MSETPNYKDEPPKSPSMEYLEGDDTSGERSESPMNSNDIPLSTCYIGIGPGITSTASLPVTITSTSAATRHRHTKGLFSSPSLGGSCSFFDKRISLYKTEMCRTLQETGHCKYGLCCQFAHTRQELRPVKRHPKYKTVICKTFWEQGSCPYGKRCCFIHNELSSSLPSTVPGLQPNQFDRADSLEEFELGGTFATDWNDQIDPF